MCRLLRFFSRPRLAVSSPLNTKELRRNYEATPNERQPSKSTIFKIFQPCIRHIWRIITTTAIMTKGQNFLLIPRSTIEFLTRAKLMRPEYLTWYDLYLAYIRLGDPPARPSRYDTYPIPMMKRYDILAARFDMSQDRIRHIINILNRHI